MTKMNSLPFTHLPSNIFASTTPPKKNSTKRPWKFTPQNNHLTFQSKFLELLELTETISEGPTPRGCSPANVPKAPRNVLQPQRVTHRKRWKCDFVPGEGGCMLRGRVVGMRDLKGIFFQEKLVTCPSVKTLHSFRKIGQQFDHVKKYIGKSSHAPTMQICRKWKRNVAIH